MRSQIGSGEPPERSSEPSARLRPSLTFMSAILTYFGWIVTKSGDQTKGSCPKRHSAWESAFARVGRTISRLGLRGKTALAGQKYGRPGLWATPSRRNAMAAQSYDRLEGV